jgi:competence ComEA-like helix-hairpin-helix protein
MGMPLIRSGDHPLTTRHLVGARHGVPGVVCLFALLFVAVFSLAAAQSKPSPPPKPLDLNKATVEELQRIPGIGPTTAKAIVRFREKSGPFRRLEDLLAIRGITKRKLKTLRPYLTVGISEGRKVGQALETDH